MKDSDDWDSHWANLDAIADRLPSQAFRHRLVVGAVRAARPTRILDVGCGRGELLERLSWNFESLPLAGIDLSATGVDIARRRVPKADIRKIDLLRDDHSSLADNFDCLTCVEVLEHLDEPIVLLREALQHLTPGGRVVVTVPSGPRTAFDVAIGHRRHFSKKTLEGTLAAAGLCNIRVRRVGFPFFDLYRIVVLLRGQRLVAAAASSSIEKSRSSRFAMRLFAMLLQINPNLIPLGLQLLAVAEKPAVR